MYSTAVLERVRNPQRVGAMPDEAADVGAGEAGHLDRGTVARIWVRVDGPRIVEARFKVFGCSAAIAAAALVAERLEGATFATARALSPADIVDRLALPAERAHVADIVVEAAQRAVAHASEKAGRQR